MTKPIEFGLVGGGWRAEFFFRIAQALPERFRVVGCVAKSEATRARIDEAISGNRELLLQFGRSFAGPLSEPHDRRGREERKNIGERLGGLAAISVTCEAPAQALRPWVQMTVGKEFGCERHKNLAGTKR